MNFRLCLGISPRCRTAQILRHGLLLLLAAASPLAARAQINPGLPDKPLPDEHSWALLIGVEGYQKFPKLLYTADDCENLAATLLERGNFPTWHVQKLVDVMPENPDGPYPIIPTRSQIMDQVERWLSQPGPEDNVIMYFSGHGYRDADGKLYLAAIDSDPKQPQQTGVPIDWLRDEVAKCRAKFKLIVLDACHAGADKSGETETKGPAAKDLGEPFRDLANVVTLASSKADEFSQLWPEKKQSLFTYWLNQGLKGHADENGDGELDIDELNKYVHRNVTHTSETRFGRAQTPVRIVRAAPGSPTVLKLQARSLKQVLTDMADELSWAMDERKLTKVAVLEFTTDTKLGEALGANFGLLGKYCSTELEQRLSRMPGHGFSVIDQRRLQSALKAQNFKIDDLGSTDAMKNLSDKVGGLPVVVLGTLHNRAGRVVNLQVKLVEAESGALVASAGGLAMLSESEWAMLGHSAAIAQNDYAPPSYDVVPNRVKADDVVHELDKKSRQAHPLSDPKFPFKVKIKIGGKERKGVFRGNDYLVPVKAGEVYEVEVENNSGEVALMKVLVDGLSTLPEKDDEMKGVTTYVPAKRVNLDSARHYVLNPKVSRRNAVRGFITETGTQGELYEFKVVDGEKSIAARQNFTEQLGLITVAFYHTKPEPRSAGATLGSAGPGFGTDFGKKRREKLQEVAGYTIGDLWAVCNIRYADESAINDYQPQQDDQPAPAPEVAQ